MNFLLIQLQAGALARALRKHSGLLWHCPLGSCPAWLAVFSWWRQQQPLKLGAFCRVKFLKFPNGKIFLVLHFEKMFLFLSPLQTLFPLKWRWSWPPSSKIWRQTRPHTSSLWEVLISEQISRNIIIESFQASTKVHWSFSICLTHWVSLIKMGVLLPFTTGTRVRTGRSRFWQISSCLWFVQTRSFAVLLPRFHLVCIARVKHLWTHSNTCLQGWE